MTPDWVRLIDANTNRLREALRVIEDVARFHHNDLDLVTLLKDARHAVARWPERAGVPVEALLRARDSRADVGRTLEATGEYARADAEDVVAANFRRAQEACRVLEEAFKGPASDLAREVEALRYRLYTWESDATPRVASERLQGLARVRIMALVGPDQTARPCPDVVRELLEAGVGAIQWRVKAASGMSDRESLALLHAIAPLCREAGALLIVNDRPDLAAAAGADGVHLGQEDLPIAAAREFLPRDTLLGLSTHDLAQVRQAVEQGVDYLGFGPVFLSGTKRVAGKPRGSHRYAEALCAAAPLPVFAIGGVEARSAARLIRHVDGSDSVRVAIAGAWSQVSDPARSIAAIRRVLESPSSEVPSSA